MIENDPLENLLPSLIQCFSIILLGYLAVRLSMISSQSTAIGTYVTKFALPAMFFRSMATIDFYDVNWFFIGAVSLGKLILFVITCLCTVLVTRPINLGMAGILSMFITQSNDVALGYPILLSLYPDLAKYIYLFAPAQLVFINPLCFILLEWHEYRSALPSSNMVYIPVNKRILLVLKNVILNPLVFMTVIGVIFNFILSHKLPLAIDKVLEMLADSFAGVALFYLGMNMVGKVNRVTKNGVYILVFLLLGKLIFLPFLSRELVVHFLNLQSPTNQSLNYSLVAFLYGGLPTAPPVFLIANSFQILPDIIATGLVLATFLSGPLMFINARVITMVVASKSQFDSILKSTSVSVSVISLIGCIWVVVVFLLSRRCRSPLHKITMCYTIFVMLTCSSVVFGRICLPYLPNQGQQHADWSHYFQFSIFFVGCIGTRLWTAIIAAALMVLKRRTICGLVNNLPYIYLFGFCTPIAITAVLLLSSSRQSIIDIDPSFQFGKSQLITSLVVLIGCISITIVCLILEARSSPLNAVGCTDSPKLKGTRSERRKSDEMHVLVRLIDADEHSLNGDHDDDIAKEDNCVSHRVSVDSEEGLGSSTNMNGLEFKDSVTSKDDYEFQIHRHFALTIILIVTMGFGVFLCLWRLINEEISGVYIELEFLDCVFNLGQGFIIWAIFGLDTELIVIPCKKRISNLWSGLHEFYIPPEGNLSVDVLRIKKQFAKYHLEKCKADIAKDIRQMFRTYSNVFSGKSLVDWIIKIGLANNRLDAVCYGQALLIGRLVEHVKKNRNLIDDDESLYRFTSSLSNVDANINANGSTDFEDFVLAQDHRSQ